MRFKSIILLIIFLLIGCGYKGQATNITHPANAFLNSTEYPRIVMNQIKSKDIRQNPNLIKALSKFDMVIINKSEDLFVDDDANYLYAKQLKALNPNIKVLQYLNISDIWDGQKTYKGWARKNPDAILKDSRGQIVHPYSDKYGNRRYMMDPTNQEWQNYFVARMKKITDQGMDGLFIDNLWRSNWQNFDISEEKFKQIQHGWETTLKKGRATIGPNKIIIGNSPPYELYQVRDITMYEGRLNPDRKSLAKYFDISKQAQKYNQINFDTVKPHTYKGDKFKYISEFFLPAALLTDNIWGISNESDQWITFINKMEKIGYPTSPAQRLNNQVLSRDFTKGKVLLNDTEAVKTIDIPDKTYKNLDNQFVNKITLKPMQGIVLKK